MRFRPTLDALPGRDCPALVAHFNGGHVLVDDPTGGNDVIQYVAAQGSSLVIRTTTGITLDAASGFPTGWSAFGGTMAGPKATVLDLAIDTGAGNDNVTVVGNTAAPAPFPLSVDLGDGDDRITLSGYAAGWPQGVTIDGGGGFDTLAVGAGWSPYAGAVDVERVQ